MQVPFAVTPSTSSERIIDMTEEPERKGGLGLSTAIVLVILLLLIALPLVIAF